MRTLCLLHTQGRKWLLFPQQKTVHFSNLTNSPLIGDDTLVSLFHVTPKTHLWLIKRLNTTTLRLASNFAHFTEESPFLWMQVWHKFSNFIDYLELFRCSEVTSLVGDIKTINVAWKLNGAQVGLSYSFAPHSIHNDLFPPCCCSSSHFDQPFNFWPH